MDISALTHEKLANMFDHTNLHTDASDADMEKLCREAAENGFKMVAVNSGQVARCKAYLKGTPVHVGAAVSFPLGQTCLEVKLFETGLAILQGADEIDYVINQTQLKNGNWDYIRQEMQQITDLCRQNSVISKVIFENCYLTKEEIRHLAQIAAEVQPDFIKTSTGFGTGGALAEDVKLMKETAGGQVRVKAAGGIRSWKDCRAMLEAGAERIGTSSSLKILAEFDEDQKK